MKLIQVLKDRITNFEFQRGKLIDQRDNLLEEADRLYASIREYDEDIVEMEIAIGKLNEKEIVNEA